jgi:hypothetical protein
MADRRWTTYLGAGGWTVLDEHGDALILTRSDNASGEARATCDAHNAIIEALTARLDAAEAEMRVLREARCPRCGDWTPQQPQRQDSLRDQLTDLHRVAARLGMYNAADWLWKAMPADPTPPPDGDPQPYTYTVQDMEADGDQG